MIWYDYVNINAININNHYELIATLSEVLNDVEVMVLPDNAIVKQDNTTDVNWLKNANSYQMFNLSRAQMDGGEKFTISNNINTMMTT